MPTDSVDQRRRERRSERPPPARATWRRVAPPRRPPRRDLGIPRRVAAGLGGLSIGLGTAELLTPRTFASALGLSPDPPASVLRVLRAIGVRELVSGAGILTQPRPAGWLWSRVAGDAVDLSLLGVAFGGLRHVNRRRLAGTMAVALGLTILDLFAAVHFTRVRREHRGVHLADR